MLKETVEKSPFPDSGLDPESGKGLKTLDSHWRGNDNMEVETVKVAKGNNQIRLAPLAQARWLSNPQAETRNRYGYARSHRLRDKNHWSNWLDRHIDNLTVMIILTVMIVELEMSRLMLKSAPVVMAIVILPAWAKRKGGN